VCRPSWNRKPDKIAGRCRVEDGLFVSMPSPAGRLNRWRKFKTGPSRARTLAVTAGRPACPLRCVLGASLGLARTCQQGAGSKTARTRHQRSAPCRCSTRRKRSTTRCPRLMPTPAWPWAPASPPSNHGKCGPARHASRVPPASQTIEQVRPLTRTAPNLGSAAIGAMRGTARALDT